MKTIKNTLSMLTILLLSVTIGCKKDKIYPEGQDPNQNLANSVSATDLENYYLVGETNGTKKLFVIYFSKEGSTVKANMHLTGALRVSDAVVANSKFSLDFDANANRLYNFEFEKDAAGSVKLKNYSLNDKTTPSLKIDHAILVKKSDSPVFTNSNFKIGTFQFKLNSASSIEWDIQIRRIGTTVINGEPFPIMAAAPEFTKPFYSLNNLGFKSNDDDFFGISVPNWKNITTPILLLERAGIVTTATKQ